MPISKIPWWRIHDCAWTGRPNMPVKSVYIQAETKAIAHNVFRHKMGIDPTQVSTLRYGQDFSTHGPYESFRSASAIERNDIVSPHFAWLRTISINEHRKSADIRVIDWRSIRPAELLDD